MKLIICRHTTTDENVGEIYSGQKDTPLNNNGRIQADKLARRIGALDKPAIGAVLSSDLQRAAHLARLIGAYTGNVPTLDPALREVNIGEMTGMPKPAALVRFPDVRHRTALANFDFRDIGGEDAPTVIRRQWQFLDEKVQELSQRGVERIVVVGHGSALRLLFRDTLGKIQKLHDHGDFQEVTW